MCCLAGFSVIIIINMAESNGDKNGHKYFRNNSDSKQNESDDSDDSEKESISIPDIGLGNNKSIQGRKIAHENSGLAGAGSNSDVPRREENPFSFKHFLNRDTCSSVGGVRRKVFHPLSPIPSPPPRLITNPELTSGLPDFVQDHLVIEQCYLNTQGTQPLAVDLDNLPDFAPGLPNDNWNANRADIPFDLTSSQRERISSDQPPVLPFDLPEHLPFDLPSGSNEVGASKSLPDFLSDGPIHSGRRTESSQPPSEPSSPSMALPELSTVQRLQLENDRLRRELDTARRQLADQIQRSETLEAELNLARGRDHDETANLEKIIEQVEDNLKRTTKRAVTAESRVTKLKQEVKLLTTELSELRLSRGESSSCTADQSSDQQLASDLRTAVNNAELSLRQMLSGVDSLRVIASALENRHRRIEEQPPDFMDQDSQDGSGPAL